MKRMVSATSELFVLPPAGLNLVGPVTRVRRRLRPPCIPQVALTPASRLTSSTPPRLRRMVLKPARCNIEAQSRSISRT